MARSLWTGYAGGGNPCRFLFHGTPTCIVPSPSIGVEARVNPRKRNYVITTQPLTVGNVAIHAHNGLYSLKDLHRASGGEENYKPAFFLRNDQTKALIAEMAKGADLHLYLQTTRGKFGGTYACRELVIAYAAWISAAFHLQVIRVFLDTVAPAPVQQALPMDDTRTAPGLDASLVNEIITSTTQNIVETLQKRRKLISWPEVIEALQNPNTEMQFADLTSLIHACLLNFHKIKSFCCKI